MIHLQDINKYEMCCDRFIGRALIFKTKKVFRKVIDLFCVWLSIDEVLTRRGKMEVKT